MEKRNEIKRIAILGAESTGKTTLARSLALRFHTEWVPEYAREYMSMHTDSYSHDDIVRIAKHQLQEEEQLIKTSNRFIFTDTEFIIAKIWSEDVFGFTPDFIKEKIREHRYDLFLLTANDLPWIPDPVRINPQRRDYFFNLYKKELDDHGFAYEIVSGRYEARLFSAVTAVKKHFGE
ncbi:MAG TPA: ATP-binding protein [Bacteroidia bacterium]|jgi:NadR type nicotinamide-nucleotide adenylyltransferase|nr:ATP-binding protein [Bacteroidia bacterium]